MFKFWNIWYKIPIFWQNIYVTFKSLGSICQSNKDFPVFASHSTISLNFKAKRKDATLTETWTKAIDRKNKDGSNWMPSKNHFICGKHFVSGRPSTNSRQGVIETWKISLFFDITISLMFFFYQFSMQTNCLIFWDIIQYFLKDWAQNDKSRKYLNWHSWVFSQCN